MMKSMIFLINPRSGKERLRQKLSDVLDIFCKAGYMPAVYVTQGPEDAERIAREYGSQADLFVCAGGDGTLNQVVTGLASLEKKPRIGYLPSGSTNDFARSLKIPTDLEKAAWEAVGTDAVPLDIGKFGEDRYFAYIAAFGAFTEVSYMTPQDKKNILGYQAYLLESVKHMASLKPHELQVQWENGEAKGEFLFGMISNTTSVGGFKGLVPKDVAFDDGLFEALFIRAPKTPVDLTEIVSCLFLKEEENSNVLRFKTKKLTVTSKKEIPWVLDGEFGGAKKIAEIENLCRMAALARQSQTMVQST